MTPIIKVLRPTLMGSSDGRIFTIDMLIRIQESVKESQCQKACLPVTLVGTGSYFTLPIPMQIHAGTLLLLTKIKLRVC